MTQEQLKENEMILVENISKSYSIYKSKRDYLKQVFSKNEKYYQEKIVLNNISFSLERGDALGIIGRNGSGKSTLLQLICGTIQQTEGTIATKGRIAALLELGSGFSPEFSGIENIYLNGLLHGLKKKEIEERIDKILGFADIGESIYDQVKTYSSGMVVRLAFSIIANIDADILVIDEALAVGDAYFTQKCMRFIRRFRENNSLLFVSHDASAILNLCNKAILLDGGVIKAEGDPKSIVEEYTRDLQKDSEPENENSSLSYNEEQEISISGNKEEYQRKWQDFRIRNYSSELEGENIEIVKIKGDENNPENFGGEEARINQVNIDDIEGGVNNIKSIKGGNIIRLVITAKTLKEIERPIMGFIIKDSKGQEIIGDNTRNKLPISYSKVKANKIIKSEFIFTIPLLKQGDYSITVSLAAGDQENHRILHWINDAVILRSECTSIAAGIAGIPMQSITIQEQE